MTFAHLPRVESIDRNMVGAGPCARPFTQQQEQNHPSRMGRKPAHFYPDDRRQRREFGLVQTRCSCNLHQMDRMGKECAGSALLLLTSGERSGNIGNIVKLDFLRRAEKMDFFYFLVDLENDKW